MAGSTDRIPDPFRVLVADDEPMTLQLIERTLRREYLVELVPDGWQALDRIRQRRYPLVLCDFSMPGLDGLEVLASIRSAWPTQGQRFVMITGGARTPDNERRLQVAGIEVLAKPFDRTRLLDLVSRYVTPPLPAITP